MTDKYRKRAKGNPTSGKNFLFEYTREKHIITLIGKDTRSIKRSKNEQKTETLKKKDILVNCLINKSKISKTRMSKRITLKFSGRKGTYSHVT